MRPIELIVEGFTSFRTRQTLDFSSLDLFAITGATGAGSVGGDCASGNGPAEGWMTTCWIGGGGSGGGRGNGSAGAGRGQ